MPEEQTPPHTDPEGAPVSTLVTVTEPLISEAAAIPATPRRKRAPTRKRARARGVSAPQRRRRIAAPVSNAPVDLFDAIEQGLQRAQTRVRANVMNVVVATGIVALIVVAQWATQREVALPATATTPAALTPQADTVVEAAPTATDTASPVTPETPEATPESDLAATATVEEATPDEVTPPPNAATPDAGSATAADAPLAEPTPSAAVTPEPTPSPEAKAATPTATGAVIETTVSIRAALDPTKAPPAEVVSPTPVIAPPPPTPARVYHAPRLRRPATAARARSPAPADVYDPYTDGGPMDLDHPTVRQHYLLQNRSPAVLSATRTE